MSGLLRLSLPPPPALAATARREREPLLVVVVVVVTDRCVCERINPWGRSHPLTQSCVSRLLGFGQCSGGNEREILSLFDPPVPCLCCVVFALIDVIVVL